MRLILLISVIFFFCLLIYVHPFLYILVPEWTILKNLVHLKGLHLDQFGDDFNFNLDIPGEAADLYTAPGRIWLGKESGIDFIDPGEVIHIY